jgi:hypothetical protein
LDRARDVRSAAFVRENRAGMYSALSYYLSKVFVELPFQILFPFMMAAIIVSPIKLEGMPCNNESYVTLIVTDRETIWQLPLVVPLSFTR